MDISQHPWFNNGIMACIFTNAVMIGVDSQYSDPASQRVFDYFELVFFAVYATAALVKIYALRGEYWRNGFNVFDFTLILVSVVQFVLQDLMATVNVTYLRIIRSTFVEFIHDCNYRELHVEN